MTLDSLESKGKDQVGWFHRLECEDLLETRPTTPIQTGGFFYQTRDGSQIEGFMLNWAASADQDVKEYSTFDQVRCQM